MGFPCGSKGKESACNAEDLSSIPGLGRSLEKGMATHFSILPGKSHGQRSLESCIVHGIAKSQTWLSNIHFSHGNSKFSLLQGYQIFQDNLMLYYTPTAAYERFGFFILDSTCYCVFYYYYYNLPVGCEVLYYLIVVLNSLSQMIDDVEHIFMCLLVICISSLENYLFCFFSLIFKFIF